MPGKNENRMSMKGEAKGHGKAPEERVSGGKDAGMYAGSCKESGGIRFPVHNAPDKSVVTSGKLPE
jgi:hypothetical protein